MWRCFVLLVLNCGLTVMSAEAPLSLYFADRPPFQYQQTEGRVVGLTAEPAEQALNRAGIAFQWKQLSAKREFQIVRENLEPACLVGWFKNTEREKFALFTLPIYRDDAPALIHRQGFAGADTPEFSQMLSHHKPRLLLKDGYSYGPVLDQLLAQHKALLVLTNEESLDMLVQIQRSRADMMFLSGAEATFHAPLLARLGLRAQRYRDLPLGEYRYLMCSRKIGPQRLAKINAAIATMALPKAQ